MFWPNETKLTASLVWFSCWIHFLNVICLSGEKKSNLLNSNNFCLPKVLLYQMPTPTDTDTNFHCFYWMGRKMSLVTDFRQREHLFLPGISHRITCILSKLVNKHNGAHFSHSRDKKCLVVNATIDYFSSWSAIIVGIKSFCYDFSRVSSFK